MHIIELSKFVRYRFLLHLHFLLYNISVHSLLPYVIMLYYYIVYLCCVMYVRLVGDDDFCKMITIVIVINVDHGSGIKINSANSTFFLPIIHTATVVECRRRVLQRFIARRLRPNKLLYVYIQRRYASAEVVLFNCRSFFSDFIYFYSNSRILYALNRDLGMVPAYNRLP